MNKIDKVKLNEAFSLVHNNLNSLDYNQRQWLLYSIDRMGETLNRNIVVCGSCNELLESKYGHDFVKCKCGTFVDGGREPGFGRYSLGHPDTQHFKTYKEALAYQESRKKYD